MTHAECEISFKTLTLSINDVELPLIKASTKPSKHMLVVNSTLAIKPRTVALVKCNVMKHSHNSSNKKHRSQVYVSATGIVHPQLRKVSSNSGFYNSKRGTLDVLVCNDSDNDVLIHRNTKVGTFDTISESFVNNVNNCFRIHANQRTCEATVNSVSEPEQPAERWSGDNINRLFKLLKLDELHHLLPSRLNRLNLLSGSLRRYFLKVKMTLLALI